MRLTRSEVLFIVLVALVAAFILGLAASMKPPGY